MAFMCAAGSLCSLMRNGRIPDLYESIVAMSLGIKMAPGRG